MYHTVEEPAEAREQREVVGIGVAGCRELLCGCWEARTGPLGKQWKAASQRIAAEHSFLPFTFLSNLAVQAESLYHV